MKFDLRLLPKKYRITKILQDGYLEEILVLKVIDEEINQTLAMKISLLPRPTGYTINSLEEYSRLKLLGSPFVSCFDAYQINEEWAFFTMEYIEGETLFDFSQKSHNRSDCLRVMKIIIEGIRKAYENKIVLRDIQPKNIYIVENSIKIIDLNQSQYREDLHILYPNFSDSPDCNSSKCHHEDLVVLPNCSFYDCLHLINKEEKRPISKEEII